MRSTKLATPMIIEVTSPTVALSCDFLIRFSLLAVTLSITSMKTPQALEGFSFFFISEISNMTGGNTVRVDIIAPVRDTHISMPKYWIGV